MIKLRSSLLGLKKRRFEIPIDQCVHYCAFRYGHNEYNPLETYLCDIQAHVPLIHARWKFIHFLLHYRPCHMGEALGLDYLSRNYPMWRYPWDVIDPSTPCKAWSHSPHSCPDILTHFCESGILSLRIDEEFLWGERVLSSIAAHGYNLNQSREPCARFSSYSPITTFELRRCDGRSAYLLLDGNHRVSALSALGQKTVTVEQPVTHIACEKDCEQWYGVKMGLYTKEDALRIFHAYFEGNHNYHTSDIPAPIIGPEQWKRLYERPSMEGVW